MAGYKNILISVNKSKTSMKAVRYVGEMLDGCFDFEICLLYVATEPHPYYYLEGHSEDDYIEEKEKKATCLFAEATNILADFGIAAQKISHRIYITSKTETISNAILRVQQEGAFGTVVVGKRGVSKAEEFLFGSISNAVTHNCKSFTVWVVA